MELVDRIEACGAVGAVRGVREMSGERTFSDSTELIREDRER